MADVVDTPVEEVEDTGLSEATQASEDDDVELEDMDVSINDLEDSESEEDEAATESTEDEPSESEDEEQSEQSEAEGGDTDPEAERKRFNAEMAQRRIAEKQARQEADEAKNALETERLQNYLAQAEDDDELYAERQKEVETYRFQQQKAELNAEKLELGVERAMTDIDLFRNGSDAAKKLLLEALDDFEAYNIVKDKQGRPIEVKGDVYQTLVKKANSIKELTQAGAVLEAKSKEHAKARAITPPTRTPKTPKTDTDLEAFDKAWE